jgi:hypothetical protein
VELARDRIRVTAIEQHREGLRLACDVLPVKHLGQRAALFFEVALQAIDLAP